MTISWVKKPEYVSLLKLNDGNPGSFVARITVHSSLPRSNCEPNPAIGRSLSYSQGWATYGNG
jgi:hypothetical protein